MEEEERLEASLKEYQTQLEFVETALAQDSKNSDLLDLKSSLQEVVLLTEENLLSVKKQRLLSDISSSEVGDNENATKSNPDMDEEFLRFQAELGNLNEERSKDDHSELASLISALEGKKCRAPYVQEWGPLSHQNAIVMNVETSPSQEVKNLEDLKVRVLFCNPLCDRMKPCSFFLDGECKFAEESCRYSHGYLVKLTQLEEFKDPDYSTLERGTVCLAKYSDGLWYQATIEECLDDHMFSVKYSKYNDTTTLKIEDILPVGFEGESSSSDEDDEDTLGLMNSDEDNDVPSVVWLAMNSSQQPLGEWEKHTRGIASKLMEKMGYVWGQGLGRNGEGRLDPIQALIFPQGKSLDKCMELREKGAIRDPEKQQQKLKQKMDESQIASRSNVNAIKKKNVFDFLNSKLGHQKGRLSNAAGSKSLGTGETSQSETPRLKERSNRALNIGSLQLNEELRRAERELERLHKSLTRNRERDRVMTSQIESRISEQRQLILSLRSQEKLIQSEQLTRKNHRKLCVF